MLRVPEHRLVDQGSLFRENPSPTLVLIRLEEGAMDLPAAFCWTKIGTEAGEAIDEILLRKEAERLISGGMFLWGIGNSIRPSLLALLKRTREPVVIFTPMLSPAALRDVAPRRVVAWRAGRGLDGRRYMVPQWCCVTSGTSGSRPLRHYALVCRRSDSLLTTEGGTLSHANLRNLRTGSMVGSSQVTSVVEHRPIQPPHGLQYAIAFRARLIYPYLVTLSETVDDEERARLRKVHDEGSLDLTEIA
jgi:hypothetical protein